MRVVRGKKCFTREGEGKKEVSFIFNPRKWVKWRRRWGGGVEGRNEGRKIKRIGIK